MVSDEELSALVGDHPERRGGSPEKGGSGSSVQDDKMKLQEQLRRLARDLDYPGAIQKATTSLIDLYGGDVKAALTFIENFRGFGFY